jgi:two-component system CheB/CheR fusion protein
VLGRRYELSGRCKNGSVLTVELALTQLGRGARRRFVVLVHDVTQRRRLEREWVEIGERERQQVGRELHDELGQVLHGIHFLASDLEVRLKRQAVAEAAELRRIRRSLEEALAVTRNLARGLQPVPPVPEGLMTALEEQAARVRKLYGVSCRFHCPKPVLVSDPAVATHLYRIAQEAVTNAVKHSGCQRLFIRLKTTRQGLVLGIEDDGHGRLPAPELRPGLGLHLMQSRAGAIHASLLVRPRAAGGTEVVCSLQSTNSPSPDSAPTPAWKPIR